MATAPFGLPLPRLRRSDDDRVVAGVCSGIAEVLGVDATLVRLAFAILALASGSGIVLYLGAWLALPAPGELEAQQGRRRRLTGFAVLLLGSLLAMRGLGLADSVLWPAALVALGVALLWRRQGSRRPGLRMAIGLVLVIGGTEVFLESGHLFSSAGGGFVAPGALTIGLGFVLGPWLWQLARERDAERLARIRAQERAEVAARVHDSVLQTLALIQRNAEDSRQVATLARQEERALRDWLYGGSSRSAGATLVAALERAAEEVEQLHGVRVEVVAAGDRPLGPGLDALVLAAREAMTNAAKFSGAEEISVYAEATDATVSVFVRDRGVGFDRAAVPTDRRGLAESIEGRMARHGGRAVVASAPGAGTEIELTIEVGA